MLRILIFASSALIWVVPPLLGAAWETWAGWLVFALAVGTSLLLVGRKASRSEDVTGAVLPATLGFGSGLLGLLVYGLTDTLPTLELGFALFLLGGGTIIWTLMCWLAARVGLLTAR